VDTKENRATSPRKEARDMQNYTVTVTYFVYAKDEKDATGQVFNHQVEAEMVDVSKLETNPTPDLILPVF
jgi:hypothetical protein